MTTLSVRRAKERGISLVEVLIALIVLSVGILAVGRLFPTGARSQMQDRLTLGAADYAQEKVEYVRSLSWSHADLADGRHPSGTATESCGNGRWQRFYTVTTMASPLDNLKKVEVTVSANGAGITDRNVTTTTYVRR